jgi:hypothetical protein
MSKLQVQVGSRGVVKLARPGDMRFKLVQNAWSNKRTSLPSDSIACDKKELRATQGLTISSRMTCATVAGSVEPKGFSLRRLDEGVRVWWVAARVLLQLHLGASNAMHDSSAGPAAVLLSVQQVAVAFEDVLVHGHTTGDANTGQSSQSEGAEPARQCKPQPTLILTLLHDSSDSGSGEPKVHNASMSEQPESERAVG